ncbi:MAG TPA: UPF0182 family protein [Vicinamibacterales bacterium]|nr:UPF0182 family protein [Vicinamibacterales bacterium]
MPLRAIVLVLAALAFFVLPAAIDFLADWLWFGEVGYQHVYSTEITTRAVAGAAAFAIAIAWLSLNVRHAIAALSPAPISFTTREGFTVALPTRDQVRPLVMILAAVVSLLVGSFVSAQWMTILSWWHQVPFNASDPVLGYDAAFYVFTLPALELTRGLLLGLIVLAMIGAGGLYFVAGQITLTPFGLRVEDRARQHLTWLAAGFFLVLALGAWLSRVQEIVMPSGIIQGATYADAYARMPAALALAAAAIVAAGLAVASATTRSTRLLIAGAAVYAVTLLVGEGYAAMLQRFSVTPNEQDRETPFMQYNIAATRAAFALENVEERELPGGASLSREAIENNRATLDNVRLWDHQPLLETFGQLQEIRPYYDFVSVDNDRYPINGQSRQVMLSVREMNPAALQNRTWINERLVFTHGYGLTLGPVNEVTSDGFPVLFVRDLPPVTTVDLNIRQPGIYFGELANDYVIVRTRAQEFDYPKGEDNVYSQYAGTGGIPVGSFWSKLLFALHFRSYQIVLSDDITNESRLIFDRQIRRRVSKIAPFLVLDDDPYPVVSDGRIFWIQDAYTVTDRYPYSTAAGNVNYIRNSVKVVIDAYHGTVTFYHADTSDPIAQTIARIFPNLMRPLGDMPEDLRNHIRYPEGIFQIQSAVYATYHMTNPAVFYNKEDQWEAPAVDSGGESRRMEPYYTMMKLPGEQSLEFIQMLPFTPRRRDNLASWMVARSDGEHYGKLQVFQFSKQTLVFGPAQVVARINQDQVIAPQITLWNQQGSQVIQGTLMVIPIEESLIYVRPLYLRAQNGRIPELTRVIVAYQNRIVMEPTLDQAIARLFGDGDRASSAATSRASATTSTPAPAASPTTGAPAGTAPEWDRLAADARATYQRALEAQKAGDWAKYGEEIRRLGTLLEQLRVPR